MQAVGIVLGCPDIPTINALGTSQMVTLPAEEIMRSASVNVGKSDRREAILASVLLQI